MRIAGGWVGPAAPPDTSYNSGRDNVQPVTVGSAGLGAHAMPYHRRPSSLLPRQWQRPRKGGSQLARARSTAWPAGEETRRDTSAPTAVSESRILADPVDRALRRWHLIYDVGDLRSQWGRRKPAPGVPKLVGIPVTCSNPSAVKLQHRRTLGPAQTLVR